MAPSLVTSVAKYSLGTNDPRPLSPGIPTQLSSAGTASHSVPPIPQTHNYLEQGGLQSSSHDHSHNSHNGHHQHHHHHKNHHGTDARHDNSAVQQNTSTSPTETPILKVNTNPSPNPANHLNPRSNASSRAVSSSTVVVDDSNGDGSTTPKPLNKRTSIARSQTIIMHGGDSYLQE